MSLDKPLPVAQAVFGVRVSSKFHERQYFPGPTRQRRVDRGSGWGLSQSAKFEIGLPEFILGGFSLSSGRASCFFVYVLSLPSAFLSSGREGLPTAFPR